MLLCGRIKSAKDAVERPFVIFQPGDFFDPFTENGLMESQRRTSVVAQPKSFGEPPANVYRPRARSIGQVSGNAQQFNAQLWKPSAFLQEFDQFSNQVTQNQANTRKIDVPQRSRTRNPVRTQFRNPARVQPTQINLPVQNPVGVQTHHNPRKYPARGTQRYQNPLLTQIQKPTAAKLQRYTSPKGNDAGVAGSDQIQDLIKQAIAADISDLPVALQKFYIEPQDPKTPVVNRGSVASAVPTHVHAIQHPAKVVDSPVEASYVHPHSSGHSGKSSETGDSRGTHYHKAHDGEESKDYEGKHHHDQALYKKHVDHQDTAYKSAESDKKEEHHDEAGHYKKHHQGEKSHTAGKFGEKKGHKRGHKTKGYHNKFHRDEYHREHRFYDDYHKEGFHEKHGDKQARYKHKEGAYKKGKSGKSGKEGDRHKKKGFSKKGHVDQEHKGFSKGGGKKKFHKHHKDYHKKKGSSGGKQYGYQSKE